MFTHLRDLHAIVVNVLIVCLCVTPLQALPVTRANFLLPVPKPLPVPVIKAVYQAGEVLVKQQLWAGQSN